MSVVVVPLPRGSAGIIYSAVIHAGMLQFQLKTDDVMGQGSIRSGVPVSFILNGRAVAGSWLHRSGELFLGALV